MEKVKASDILDTYLAETSAMFDGTDIEVEDTDPGDENFILSLTNGQKFVVSIKEV